MNERIKELIEQARESATTRHPVSNITLSVNSELFEQKFAELIVQRTLDIVEAHTEIFQSDEARAMVEHIKQSVKTDFGIEK